MKSRVWKLLRFRLKVQGYLRTGNILQKMDKLDAAIGIYKYGIKNVSVADENFKVSTSNVERQKASTRLDISQRAKLRFI